MQVCADALAAEAHKLLGPQAQGDVNGCALAEVVEGAASSVPAAVLEATILGGCCGPEACAWRGRMTVDLVSPKVSELFRELHRHKDKALAALKQVPHGGCSSVGICAPAHMHACMFAAATRAWWTSKSRLYTSFVTSPARTT